MMYRQVFKRWVAGLLCGAVILAGSSIPVQPASAATEQIKAAEGKLVNPGFDLPLVNGEIPGWSLATGSKEDISIGTEQFVSAPNSLHFKDSSTSTSSRVVSDPVAVTPGDLLVAKNSIYVLQQTHNIVLQLYFYDANHVQLKPVPQELFGAVTLGSRKWSEMKLQTTVPEGAAYVRYAINSGAPSLTEAYVDNVVLQMTPQEQPLKREYQKPVDLGPMVSVNLGQAGAIQQNARGENEVYFVTNGLPGTFTVVDGETGKLKFAQDIPNTEATWAMTVGPDKNVYFAGTGDGMLYRYLPADQKIEKLGFNGADNWVWDLEAIGSKIYGGTFNDKTGGKVFEYDIETGKFRNYGTVQPGQQYVRGIAVDDRYIYAGMGTTLQLFKIDRVTGEKSEIHIPGYSGTTGTIADVFIVNGKLMVSVSTVNMVVMDLETLKIEHTFQYSNMISEPAPNDPNVIYYKFGAEFFKYNFSTNTSEQIKLAYPLPDTVRVKDMSWITLKSGSKAGKTVLAMVTQYGEYILYDPSDNSVTFVELEISPQPVRIQAIESGIDGRLYFGGYQRGMSVYNPFTGKIDLNISSFPQPEGIGFLNGKVYFGTYVSAVMYSYDPSLPVSLNKNPKLEYDIEHQDRPFAMTSGDDKLFVGTVPDYGVLGGALAVFDEKKGTWKQYNHDQVVRNQSIISLAYKDGLLYGGTTVWGGLGIDPSEPQAKIFIWDVKNGRKIDEFTPDIPGIDEAPRMIGDLSFGPDGLLWGAVDGTIFAMDPATKKVVKSKLIRPSTYNTSKWMPFHLRWAPDGMLYTTLSRKLIAIDPETLQYKVIDDRFMNSMTIGIDGTIYYAPEAGTNMSKIPVPETDATLADLKVNGRSVTGFSPGVLEYYVNPSNKGKVEVKTSQAGADVEIKNIQDRGQVTVIRVTGTDGKSQLSYKIHWKVKKPGVPGKPQDPGKR